MRVVIRADADDRIGSGHFVRCAALAAALQAAGAQVIIATSPLVPALAADLDPGVTVRPVPARHPDPLDLVAMRALLNGTDWVVVDGYHFDAAYQRALGETQARVAVIDDLADQGPYSADLVVNHGPGAWHLPYVGTRETRFLLGLSFALLRPEFAAAHRAANTARREPDQRRVLVTLGGSDPANLTDTVLQALGLLGDRRLHTTVVVGAANPRADELRARIAQLQAAGAAIEAVTPSGRAMAELMKTTDLAIANAGGTLWELACCGIPTIAVTAASNQAPNAEVVARLGLAVVVGAGPTPQTIADAVIRVLDDDALVQSLVQRGTDRVDGRGAERVARAMLAAAPDWTIRPARPDDVEAIWQINSDPTVRAMSFSKQSIPFEQHEKWYQHKLADRNSCLFVAERDGMVAGQVRYDRKGDDAIISLTLAAAYRGRGLGTRLFAETFAPACAVLGVNRVEASVFFDNPASAQALFKAGYTQERTHEVDGRQCWIIARRLES